MRIYRDLAGMAFIVGLGIVCLAAYGLWAGEASFDRGQRVDGIMSRLLTDSEMAEYSRSNRRPARFDRTPYYVWIGVGGAAILGAFFLLGMANARQPGTSDQAAVAPSPDDPPNSN